VRRARRPIQAETEEEVTARLQYGEWLMKPAGAPTGQKGILTQCVAATPFVLANVSTIHDDAELSR